MPFCEIITKFTIDKHEQLNKIITEKSVFFTNDSFIFEEMSQLGYSIKLINNYLGLYNEKINKINEEAIRKFDLLQNYENNESIKEYNIHHNLRYFHLQRLIFLEIINEILKEKKDVVFLFSNLVFHYFSIMDLAKKFGYEKKYGIITFKDNEIESVFFDETRTTKLQAIEKELGEIRTDLDILYVDNYESRIEEINIKEVEPKYAFFLINNETDFYLKPVYPILKKFQEKQTEFSIFTFDLLTYTQLSKKGFHPNDLTEYIDELSIKPYKIMRKINKINLQPTASPNINKTFEDTRNKVSQAENIQVLYSGHEIKKNRWDRKLHVLKIRLDRKLHVLKRKTRWHRRKHFLKRKYLRAKRRILYLYFNNLQYIGIIRWLVSRPLIKQKLIHLAGLEEDEFVIDIPEKEMKTIQKIVNSSLIMSTSDIVLKSYLNYFNDNYLVNYVANNLAIYTILDLLFKKFKFSSVFVAMDGSPANNTVCTIAKKYNIPTYSLPQVFVRINKIQVALPSASNIFVSGKKINNELIKFGANENRLLITGNPRYDFLKQDKKEPTNTTSILNRIFKKNIQFSRDLIIVAMSRWHKNDHLWMSKLIYFCNQNNLDILIKIHPMYKSPINYDISKEKVNRIKKLCQDLKFTVSYDIDLTKLWPQTKILITEHSIVAIEAALSSIPIIVTDIDSDEEFEGSEYQKDGIALYATSIEELSHCIKKILYDETTKEKLQNAIKKFCHDYNYLNDGNSTERIYNMLTKTE